MKISVWHRNLSDSYLRYITQLGANCIDFGRDHDIPGVPEQGYPDLDELLKIKKNSNLGDWKSIALPCPTFLKNSSPIKMGQKKN